MIQLQDDDIFKISSNNAGLKVCILGGVHGNEVCGVMAIEKFLDLNIKLIKGEIIFVYANRKAINSNKRFIEENLNRCFLKEKLITNSYEENLAKDLMEILNDCDVCLDLHASISRKSEPFIICEENAFSIVKCFPINKVCSGFDKIEPGGTDYYMNLIGKIGICVECGYLGDEKSTDVALNSIFSLLGTLGMYKFKQTITKKKYFGLTNLYHAKNEFLLDKKFEDFDYLKEGDLIGVDGNNKIEADEDGFVLFARTIRKNDRDREAFLFGRRINY